MKKLIYSLSIAMAVGMAANAANPAEAIKDIKISKDQLKEAAQLQSNMVFDRIDNNGTSRKAKRVATPAELSDFLGSWSWSGRNLLDEVVAPNDGVLTISVNPQRPAELIISGFNYEIDLKGSYDASTGTVVIPDQFISTNDYYNEEVWFMNWSVKNGVMPDGTQAYELITNPGTSFYFSIDEDGRLKGGAFDSEKWNNHTYTDAELLQDICVAMNVMPNNDSGAFWACMFVNGIQADPFEFVTDEWTSLGYTDFKDAWFSIFWDKANSPNYDVELFYNKTTPGVYLLYDPYGPDTPYGYYEISLSSKPGFLIFDINDPECVVFQPMVFSTTLDMRESADDDLLPTDFYCFNYEGYSYYILKSSKEEIIVYGDQNYMDISNLDQRSKQVNIYNAIFSFGMNPSPYYEFDGYPNDGYIKLPDNYMDAVDSVLGEDLNAPVVYYNLQGQKVVNPQKGQLVIAKQGNKATKKIVR